MNFTVPPAGTRLLTDQIYFESAKAENVAQATVLAQGALFHTAVCGLRTNLCHYSTVPTRDEVLVPETLLKKRKSQEKARAERAAEQESKRKVSDIPSRSSWRLYDAQHNHHQLDIVDAVD